MFSSIAQVGTLGLVVVHAKRALLVIDMQDCFSNTNSMVGTLPVDDATDSYFQRTAAWIERHGQFYDKIIYSRDYHMKGHVSFLKTHFTDKTDDYARSILAGSHSVELTCAEHGDEGFCSPRLTKFDRLTGELELASCKPDTSLLTICEDAEHPPLLAVKNGSRVNFAAEHCLVGSSALTSCQSLVQSLWPEHCVDDNEVNPLVMKALESVNTSGRVEVVFKGTDLFVDSYSAFNDNVNFTDSQMPRILSDNNIEQTHVIGLAYDFCVGQTALSSKARGHPTTVIAPFTGAVAPFLADLMSEQLAANNVEIVSEDGLAAWERKTFGTELLV